MVLFLTTNHHRLRLIMLTASAVIVATGCSGPRVTPAEERAYRYAMNTEKPEGDTQSKPGSVTIVQEERAYRYAMNADKTERATQSKSGGVTIVHLNLELVRIRAGSFLMGTPGAENDESPKRVKITSDYWIGATEVTQAQWRAVMGTSPSHFRGENLPVEQVSWDDAMAFCRKLTETERAAGRLPDGYEYTLPTEAEWEYACRAGTLGKYAGDLGAMAWYDKNAASTTHSVATKQANAWGLYDMHGNVWEWCCDWYGDELPGGTDPTGASWGVRRVARGGSWFYVAGRCRSASRYGNAPDSRNIYGGFRLALSAVKLI